MSEQTTQNAAPQITIPDLANAYNIIKVAIERATFKAEEISGVGRVFDVFGAFLKAAEGAQQEQAKAEAAPADEKPAE